MNLKVSVFICNSTGQSTVRKLFHTGHGAGGHPYCWDWQQQVHMITHAHSHILGEQLMGSLFLTHKCNHACSLCQNKIELISSHKQWVTHPEAALLYTVLWCFNAAKFKWQEESHASLWSNTYHRNDSSNKSWNFFTLWRYDYLSLSNWTSKTPWQSLSMT